MPKARKCVQDLKRLKDFGSERSGFVRLDKNERTAPFEDRVFQAIMGSIRTEDLTAYPDQTPLYAKLAKALALPVGNILLTSGSDAAIKLFYETYVEPGDEVIYLDPTYAMIDVYADLFRAKKVKIGYSSDLKLDFDRLVASISPATKLVFICNPNQPTGTCVSLAQIREVLKRAHVHDTLVILDEAYIQFARVESSLQLLREFPNLAITQTFSKAYGLASVRLGYIAAHTAEIDQLYKSKTLCDINLLAIKAGEYLVEHANVLSQYVKDVNDAKAYLAQQLVGLDIQTIPSEANFIHFRMTERDDVKAIADQMKSKGYLIRTAGNGLPAVLDGCIRITVGPLAQMKEFLVVFTEVIRTTRAKA